MPRPEEETKKEIAAAAQSAGSIVGIDLYGDTAVVRLTDKTMIFVNKGGEWKAVP
jgi:hypothetical protein